MRVLERLLRSNPVPQVFNNSVDLPRCCLSRCLCLCATGTAGRDFGFVFIFQNKNQRQNKVGVSTAVTTSKQSGPPTPGNKEGSNGSGVSTEKTPHLCVGGPHHASLLERLCAKAATEKARHQTAYTKKMRNTHTLGLARIFFFARNNHTQHTHRPAGKTITDDVAKQTNDTGFKSTPRGCQSLPIQKRPETAAWVIFSDASGRGQRLSPRAFIWRRDRQNKTADGAINPFVSHKQLGASRFMDRRLTLLETFSVGPPPELVLSPEGGSALPCVLIGQRSAEKKRRCRGGGTQLRCFAPPAHFLHFWARCAHQERGENKCATRGLAPTWRKR